MFYALVETGKSKFYVSAITVEKMKHIKRLLCPYCKKPVYNVQDKYFRHKKGTCTFAEKNVYSPLKEEVLNELRKLSFKDWTKAKEDELQESIPDFFIEKEKTIAVFVDSEEKDWKSCLNIRIYSDETKALERAKKDGVGYWYDHQRKQIFAIRNGVYIPIKKVERIYYYNNKAHLVRFMQLIKENDKTITVKVGTTEKEIDRRFKILCYGK